MRVFRIIARAAVAFYDELFYYFLMGLIHTVAWLLVIPGPFALAGVYVIGQKAVRGLGVKWHHIWAGVKEFGLRALLLALIVVFGYGVIVLNLWFYNTPEVSPFPASVGVWMTPLWGVLAVIWTGVAFYAQSFLMELKEPKMLLVLRNSFFLIVLHPIQTLILLIVSALAIVLSVLLPVLVVVSPGFISVLSLTAVRTLVTALQERVEEMEEASEESGASEGEEETAETEAIEVSAEEAKEYESWSPSDDA
ncbi:MAG: hypothetical protein ACP5JG_13205 [Anaerolineae bacterium]